MSDGGRLMPGEHGDERRCLSFTVSGPWAHFRRVEGNIVKQTYRLIPRTTVAGLVAAMLGIGRDEYYDLFAPDASLVAVEPVEELRTLNMPMNALSTANEDMKRFPKRGRRRIGHPDSTKLRQQHNYEVLVDPSYRIDLWLADDRTRQRLRESLADGRSHYVPSLGLSEHLATIEYHGEYDIEAGPGEEVVEVDSAVVESVDSIVIERRTRCQMERSPGHMRATGGGRVTTGFVSYAYNPDAGVLAARDVPTHTVDGRTVMFS